MSEDIFIGLDIGGTKTSLSLGSVDGVLLAFRRVATEAAAGPECWFERVKGLLDELRHEAPDAFRRARAVGVAAPGPMSVARGCMIAPPNLPGWREVPVAKWMAAATNRPVFINNDANAAGLAEYFFGEFRGTPDLVYLTLSTGIGAGVISGGRLVQGARDLGGEVGHHVLDREGPLCPCGQRGCWEMYCGGRNVADRLRARIAAGARSRVLELAGGNPERIDFRALVAAAREGDALATEFWTEFIERLAQGIGTILMFFNPSAVLLGTIAIHTGEFLLVPLHAALPRYAWSLSRKGVRITPSVLGERIGDLAAIAVAIQGIRAADVRPPGCR